jgi:hypothetical protein
MRSSGERTVLGTAKRGGAESLLPPLSVRLVRGVRSSIHKPLLPGASTESHWLPERNQRGNLRYHDVDGVSNFQNVYEEYRKEIDNATSRTCN